MRLSANNFVLISNFVCFTSCLLISSLIWSSILFTTSLAVSNGNNILLKEDNNELSHSFSSASNSNQWRVHQRIPPLLLKKLQAKLLNQHWLRETHKRQMDDQTGAQDHRTKQTTWAFNPLKEKRHPMVEYDTLTELFPQMMPELSVDEAADLVTEELMNIAPDKRPDNIVYKDGFLGVRG